MQGINEMLAQDAEEERRHQRFVQEETARVRQLRQRGMEAPVTPDGVRFGAAERQGGEADKSVEQIKKLPKLNVTPLDVAKTLAFFHSMNTVKDNWTPTQITTFLIQREPGRYKDVLCPDVRHYVKEILKARPMYFVKSPTYDRYALSEDVDSPFSLLATEARAIGAAARAKEVGKVRSAAGPTPPNHWNNFTEATQGRGTYYRALRERQARQQQQQRQDGLQEEE